MNIGWIDFSTDDRKQVKHMINALGLQGQLDQMRIGYLRDSIANDLFPGISTIQTRAKYFFIIPYIIRDYVLEYKKHSKQSLSDYLKSQENKIKNKLRNKYHGQTSTGVIGIRTTGNLSTRPSAIYWTGLNTFGIIQSAKWENKLSLNVYLDSVNQQLNTQLTDEDETSSEIGTEINIPQPPIDWNSEEVIDINLDLEEALHLEERIKNHINQNLQKSLLCELLKNSELHDILLAHPSFIPFAREVYVTGYDPDMCHRLMLAHNFTQIGSIIHLLYDDLLQTHFFTSTDGTEIYDGRFMSEARTRIEGLTDDLLEWDNFNIGDIFHTFEQTKVKETQGFLLAIWPLIRQLADKWDDQLLEDVQKLIKQQEREVKNQRARLTKKSIYDTDMEPNKKLSLGDFDYRYTRARQILIDIHDAKKK